MQSLIAQILSLLPPGEGGAPAGATLIPLVPDGSTRSFFRLRLANGRSYLAILPPDTRRTSLAEARACDHIGRHLQSRDLPVPMVYGRLPATGLVVCEDLGDVRLHDLVRRHGLRDKGVQTLYCQAVRILARMQVLGAKGWRQEWCWDTPVYDYSLMVARESAYFLQALCQDYLGITIEPAVRQECHRLAVRAAQSPAHFFLHRDFQSRNLMVCDQQIRIIDYQGGRLGPLAYDLASLLIDPYGGLDRAMQDHLLAVYLDELATLIPLDRNRFLAHYPLLALQRNMQILGAFAFLSQQRHKPFFTPYIRPALASLARLIADLPGRPCPRLQALVHQCRHHLERDPPKRS